MTATENFSRPAQIAWGVVFVIVTILAFWLMPFGIALCWMFDLGYAAEYRLIPRGAA